MSFTTQRLVGSRVLVQGTDTAGNTGSTILDATQWDEVNAHKDFDEANSAFKDVVDSFFAPLLEAGEKLKKVGLAKVDPATVIVLHEAVEGQAAQDEVVVKLNHDSVVLRMIEQSASAPRLIWVAPDQLEVLEADTPLPAPVEAEVNGVPDFV